MCAAALSSSLGSCFKRKVFLIPHPISTLLCVVDCSGVRPLPAGRSLWSPSVPRGPVAEAHAGGPAGPLEKARVQAAPLEEASIGQS